MVSRADHVARKGHEFVARPNRRDCRACHRLQELAAARRRGRPRRLTHVERFGHHRVPRKRKPTDCLECHRLREQERYWRDPDEARALRRRKAQLRPDYMYRWHYGIGLEEVQRMIAAQGGRCAICLRSVKLQLDHDHETGLVRGMLCSDCNNGLGRFRDVPTYLRRAAAYLEKAIAQHGEACVAVERAV